MLFIFMQVDQQAKDEFSQMKEQWEKNISIIRERQLSLDDVQKIYIDFKANTIHFQRQYQGRVDVNIMHEFTTTFSRLERDLNLAVQKGKQNYRNNKHEQNIAYLWTIGKIVIGLFGILCTLLAIKYAFNIPLPV